MQKRDDIIIFQTDKSGRFSVDTKTNYEEACEKHIENDIDIDEKEYKKCQREINGHSTFWTRILQAGKDTNGDGENRVRNNMQVENHGTAPLYSLRKDHKKHANREKGPPTRPVCAGNMAYNHKLSHLISEVIKPLTEEMTTNCENTEEILAEIRKINEAEKEDKDDERDVILGSLDVVALYPSLQIDYTAKIVSETFVNSDLKIEGIDTKELGLYISLNTSNEQMEMKENIRRFCPTRKTKKGKPTVSGHAAKNDTEDRYKQWTFPDEEPNEHEKKEMVAEALEIVIKFVMTNHIYECNGNMKKQREGGPIGLELTGELAKIMMSWFDKQMIKKIEEQSDIRLKMYKRYVDDINVVMKVEKDDNKGNTETETTVKKIIEDESDEKEENQRKEIMIENKESNTEERNNRKIEKDAEIMERMKKLGDDIHPSIKLTFDCPSKNQDRKLPILDVKMWVEKEQNGKSTIMHEFYQKDMSSKHVVHSRSGMSTQQKRTILTQEALRILQRCSENLNEKITKEHLSEFSRKMQFSGYEQKFREEVLRSALTAYERMREKDEKGEKPIYRDRQWKRKERKQEKREKKRTWHKKDGSETVVFIPATPNSELKKQYEKVIKDSKVNMKVIEKRGHTLQNMLQKSRPTLKRKCKEEDECLVCESGGKGDCKKENVTYEISCNKCKKVYIGETCKNAYTRGKQHKNQLQTQDKDSVLYRHNQQDHHQEETTTTTFKMNVLQSHRSALCRQITEAVKIDKTPNDKLINNKAEWGHNKVVKMQTVYE